MKNKKKHQIKNERLLYDEVNTLHKSKGNGILRRQVWIDNDGKIIRYSLAYINHYIFRGDNGRVLGYDNAHDYHHRHYMGNVEPVIFKNYDDIEMCFQREFEVIHEENKKKK